MTDLLETIAYHEAGHAVMRWLRGLSAGALTMDETGGLCAGTGELIDPESALLVALAGIAVEAGYGLCAVDLKRSYFDDLTEAQKILAGTPWLRLRVITTNRTARGVVECVDQSVDDALAHHFARASEILFPYADVVEEVAMELLYKRHLPAADVAEIIQAVAEE